METLVLVEQHKNQYYSSRSKPQGRARFGSSPSKEFRGINCRTFMTTTGILPIPLHSPSSPKSPLPTTPSNNKTFGKTTPLTTPIPINAKALRKEKTFPEDVLLSELWAGPTYSNSPPPSSLPIPKFSVMPRRTVSLELPGPSSPEIEILPVAKSVPPSPGRDHSPSTRDLFVNADSATKTLRRILNLNINDD
ncbi:hypothetical protein Lal_00011658 [Lupinus albus]|uniref:Uncharacterized protein n=1 Tax=Lupinus albus TaxID=3870 RepID=A0A6A5N666_LUPAL|nr:hypothetical protein Lalb_Chr06g0162891 [Lupinus albus]KAF1880599.1 hypothetical protein Lal_00011658 [Lupinus albus]